MTTILLTVILLALATHATAATPRLTTLIAEHQVGLWRCQDQLGIDRTQASVEPWALPRSDRYRRWVLELWKQRHAGCAADLREWKRQWNWKQWLPAKWYRIARCETQVNWQHYNSSYEGAFGFATQSWDSFKPAGYPDHANQATPWQQYMVALAIYRAYGLSGWGCRNA